MRTQQLVLLSIGTTVVLCGSTVSGQEWITARSYYTHDPDNGQRVQQYSPIGPFYVQPRADYRRSGFRHTRSSIQAGGSSDNLHIVEEWGRPVRPYGEWRFPYRPNSVPYDLWGPPVAPFGHGFPRHSPVYRPGQAYVPPGPAGQFGPHPRPLQASPPGYRPQPWHDGRYPPYDSRGPYGYPDLRQRETKPY